MKNSLRPKTFEDFIGQDRLKQTIKVIILSAIKRKKQTDHILLHGPPGLGKTSLAYIIGEELGGKIKFAQGPLLEKKADLLSLFASITTGDIIFIDEIHGVNKSIDELLYSAMEDGVIDVIIGPEGDQKIMRMKLPKFTLIGATTNYSRLSKPLKDRFGFIGKLVDYTEDEIKTIVKNSSKTLKIKIDEESINIIAMHSRNTPRVANNLLKRCNDFLVSKDEKSVNKSIVYETFKNIGLYKYGLNDHHISYLKVLADSFEDRWTSIDSIVSIMGDAKNNIEKEVEPVLITNSLIEKGARGRKITNKGIEYLNTHNLNI